MSFRPVKPRTVGSTADLVARAFDAAGGVKRVAHVLGMKKTQAYAYSDETESSELSLDAARRLAETSRAAALVFAEDFCAEAGAAVLPLAGDEDAKLLDLLAAEQEAQGRMMARLLTRLARHQAGKLPENEQRELRRDILDVMRPLAAAVAGLSGEG